LVVDDNAVNRKLMFQVLVRAGYSDIATACDGLNAVDVVSTRHFDFILMDHQMPKMDGMTACKTIRKLSQEQRRKQPVIIGKLFVENFRLCGRKVLIVAFLALTAHTMHGDKEECLTAG